MLISLGWIFFSSWVSTSSFLTKHSEIYVWILALDWAQCLLECCDVEHMQKKSCFLGWGDLHNWNEMNHFIEPIHSHHYKIKSFWWWKTHHEVHGTHFPMLIWNKKKPQFSYLFSENCSILNFELACQTHFDIFYNFFLQV